jgi:hypothetical protein
MRGFCFLGSVAGLLVLLDGLIWLFWLACFAIFCRAFLAGDSWKILKKTCQALFSFVLGTFMLFLWAAE